MYKLLPNQNKFHVHVALSLSVCEIITCHLLIFSVRIILSQHAKIVLSSVAVSYLFISKSIQIMMIVAEVKISQNGVPIANNYILILRCRLDDGVHQDLKRESIVSEHFNINMNSGRQYIKKNNSSL